MEGTVKTLASSPNRTTAIAKRPNSETRRNAETGGTAMKQPARAKTAKKLKALAARTGDAMSGCKLAESSEGTMTAHDGDGKQYDGGRVDHEGGQMATTAESPKNSRKNDPDRHRQRNQVGVVAAIEKNGIPAPDSGGTRDGHGKHDEEIFIGNGRRERIKTGVTAQESG